MRVKNYITILILKRKKEKLSNTSITIYIMLPSVFFPLSTDVDEHNNGIIIIVLVILIDHYLFSWSLAMSLTCIL